MAGFDRIALSLSGGGFRAAAFHLGVLMFLERVGILRNVRALSTASGGTIAGAYYAQCLADGTPFEQFVERFYTFLRDVDVIDEALKKVPARSAKLIAAAADVYARTLFPSLLGDVQRSKDHLEEITFNATDMAHGLAFRFVKTSSRFVRTGNRAYNIPNEAAAQLRLADVVAASSCFPAAFEPMVFPDDFLWSATSSGGASVPLMDGGIYDNQGIAGLLLVRNRRSKEIDTIIVSDADRASDTLYEEPQKAKRGMLRVWMVLVALITFTLAAIASSMELWGTRQMMALVVTMIAAITTATSLIAIALLIRLPIPSRPRPLLWRHVLNLSVRELIAAVHIRASSLVALTSRIFMKRIRNLTYEGLFQSVDTGKKSIGNLMTELPRKGEGTVEMRVIAQRAAEMPTELWFDDEQELAEAIATGQMTTCFNLLQYMERHPHPAPLFERCSQAWERYRSDPLADVPRME